MPAADTTCQHLPFTKSRKKEGISIAGEQELISASMQGSGLLGGAIVGEYVSQPSTDTAVHSRHGMRSRQSALITPQPTCTA